MTPELSPQKPKASRAWIIATIVLVLGFDLAFLWQRRAAAPASELGAHPEEAAHYLTGLAARDYFAHHLADGPNKSFADFATHYPVVRSVAQPPLFAIVQAAWISAFGKSRTSVLFLMALTAAVVALLLHLALREEFGDAAAIIAAALFLSLPLVREHTATLLPVMLGTAFIFAAALAFTHFLARQRLSDALIFGVLAALAILTDRMGLALILFVPLALLLSKKTRLLARPSLWAALALAAAPAWFFHAAEWKRASLDFTRAASQFYPAQFATALGVILLLIAIPVLLFKINRPAERTPHWSAATALFVSVLLFLLLAPAELDPAQLLPALPVAILFAVAGCAALAKRFARSTAFVLLIAAVLTIAIFESVMVTWRAKNWSGFRALAEIVRESGGQQQPRILVSSDPTGEGMFLSEMAMIETQPVPFIQRADTLLASTHFGDDEELANLLTSLNFDYIVFDESNPDLDHAQRQDMLRRVLREHSDRFWEMSSSPVVRDGIAQNTTAKLYRVMGKTR